MSTRLVTLGPRGTYSHQAAMLAASLIEAERDPVEIRFRAENSDVLKEIAYRKCFGVVPIGNTLAGLVSGVVIDFWLKQHSGIGIFVIGEIRLPIEHHLLVHPSIKRVNQIRAVMSHPHALAQCGDNLNTLKIRMRVEATSTAEAARLVSHGRKLRTTAAIASRLAGEMYGLHTLRSKMEDSRKKNATRFHILGPEPAQRTGNDCTAVIFRTSGKPGALVDVLGTIRSEHVNLTEIRSIRTDEVDGSIFYGQFDAHRNTESGRRILKRMREQGRVIVLGSYPKNFR